MTPSERAGRATLEAAFLQSRSRFILVRIAMALISLPIGLMLGTALREMQ